MNSEELQLQTEIAFLSNLIGKHKSKQGNEYHIHHTNTYGSRRTSVSNNNKYKVNKLVNDRSMNSKCLSVAKLNTDSELKLEIAKLEAVINRHKQNHLKAGSNSLTTASGNSLTSKKFRISNNRFSLKNSVIESSHSAAQKPNRVKLNITQGKIAHSSLYNCDRIDSSSSFVKKSQQNSEAKLSNRLHNNYQWRNIELDKNTNSTSLTGNNSSSLCEIQNRTVMSRKRKQMVSSCHKRKVHYIKNNASGIHILQNRSLVHPRHPYTTRTLKRTSSTRFNNRHTWRNIVQNVPTSVRTPRKISQIGKCLKERNCRVVQIGGMWYKSSNLKLQKTDLSSKNTHKSPIKNSRYSSKKSKIINVRGVKFSLDRSKKQLVRVGIPTDSSKKVEVSRVDLGGITYIQTKPGLLTKSNTSHARQIVSRAVIRSISRVHKAKNKKMVKKNRYCMFYNRFGKCNKGKECTFVHDPEKIAVCTRFLRGTCKLSNCSFSHKISKSKMPVCSYFLKGRCTLDSCPYLHVNVNPEAKPCRDFIAGFCPKGSKCKQLHSLVCPAYLKNGTCVKGSSCPLKHKKRVRKVKKVDPDSANLTESLEFNKDGPAPIYISLNKVADSSGVEEMPSKGHSLKVLPSFLTSNAR